MKERILFLGKRGDSFCEQAYAFCEHHFATTACFGEWGDPKPEAMENWSGDYIISYLSRWVVPQRVLNHASRAAINFHPATPDYPGIGCINFALYQGARQFGATCHRMWPKVDTGPIIKVRRVPVFKSDDVCSLLARTYEAQFQLFLDVLEIIKHGRPLPMSSEKWGRKPYTREEFNELNQILPGMSPEEEAKRIRCCAFGPYSPKRVLVLEK